MDGRIIFWRGGAWLGRFWRGVVRGRGSAPSVLDIWVKPEVAPPRGGALPRGSCKWEGPSSGMTHFSAV
jgi:hypothetical protein